MEDLLPSLSMALLLVSTPMMGCLDDGSSKMRHLGIEYLGPEEELPALHLLENETREKVPRLIDAFDEVRENESENVVSIPGKRVVWHILGYLNRTAREEGMESFEANDTIDGRVNWTGGTYSVSYAVSIE